MKIFYTISIAIAAVIMALFLTSGKEDRSIKKTFYSYDRAAIENRVRQKAYELKPYAVENWLDTDYVFLIDFSIPSGFNRMFLYEYARDTILYECLVAHGSGLTDTTSTWDGIPLAFSNVENSHLSSLGKYIIGERGKSIWGVGVKYVLEGLDYSNDLAKQRDIVLHSWGQIPNKEVYPLAIEESWGCPAVSDSCFAAIDGIIYYRPVHMMLYIYN